MSFITFPARIEGLNFRNTGIGFNSLLRVTPAPTTGNANTAYGYNVLTFTTTGRFNTGIGSQALEANSTGSSNTGVGDYALQNNISGTFNTALGRGSLSSTDSIGSTGVGANSLLSATGGGNTAIGYGSGSLITTGQNNTVLGPFSGNQGGYDIRTLSNYVVIADGAGNPRIIVDPAGLVSAPGGFSGGGGGTLTIDNKTAAYTVVSGDLGKIVNCTSGTFTVSLTAAATLGSGFNCWIWNTSTTATDIITIDPNGAETIDGVATLTLRRGEGTQIVCNGTNWQTGDKKTMRAYAENIGPADNRPSAVGDRAVAIGSSYASGTDSFAAVITNNTVTYGARALNSIAMGDRNQATFASATVVGGSLSSAGGGSSFVSGAGCSTGFNSFGSVALGNGATNTVAGKFSFAGTFYSVAFGTAQMGMMCLSNTTPGAAATVLTSNGGAASTTNQLILPDNTAHAFSGIVVARQKNTGGTQSAAWSFSGLIRRDAGAGTTTVVASTVTVISNVPGWTLALSADTVNGGLAVTATGAAATDIRWHVKLDSSEVTYT